MKLLTVSLNKLELARFQLRKPLLVVGRSPTCDVVLRAPGIKPVHFIIEWIGNGQFNASEGLWSIADVSSNVEAGEGVVLSKDAVKIGDVSFSYIESGIESSEVIGGTIAGNLTATTSETPDLLEFVQVRNDSGAIEEVNHIAIPKKTLPLPVSKEFKTFKVERNDLSSEHILNVMLQELPGAELFLSGRKIAPSAKVPLGANDFLRVKWNGRDFYLRFVDEVKSPPAPVDFWGDPLLKYLTIGAAVILFLIFEINSHLPKKPPEEPPPVRVARIELPPPPPVEAPPPADKMPENKTETTEKPPEPVKEAVEKKVVDQPKGKAGAASVTVKPNAPVKAGLNIKAPPANVNQIGILGALNKNVSKGPGVSADQVINKGIIHEAITGKNDAKIVISNPPAGVVGKGSSGAPNGKVGANLGSASTTLSGVKSAAADSKSLIARAGGTGESSLGMASSGTGRAEEIGDDANNFSVAGGLDRDTVRRIIQSYRAQVRACYDRALVSSPNLHGRIVYSWKILSDGGVVEARIAKTTVDSSNLKACVLEVIQQMQFPKSPRGLSTTVIYPFVFQGMK